MFVRRIFMLLSFAVCLAIGAASAEDGKSQRSPETDLAFLVRQTNLAIFLQCTPCRSCGNGCGNNSC